MESRMSNLAIYSCGGMKFYRDAAQRTFRLDDYSPDKPTLFLGVYFREDLSVLMTHKSRAYVFWNGSDVSRTLQHLEWHEPLRKVRAEHATHNAALAKELLSIGITAEISPILFHPRELYRASYYPSHRPKVYMTIHPGREEEYGLSMAVDIFRYLDADLYVYGNAGGSYRMGNVHFRGWVDEWVWSEETSHMHGALRLNKHDGTSQIVLKAELRGHYTIVTPSPWEAFKGVSDLSSEPHANLERTANVNTWIDGVQRRERELPETT
jgi:hypothetical protein